MIIEWFGKGGEAGGVEWEKNVKSLGSVRQEEEEEEEEKEKEE